MRKINLDSFWFFIFSCIFCIILGYFVGLHHGHSLGMFDGAIAEKKKQIMQDNFEKDCAIMYANIGKNLRKIHRRLNEQ